MKLNWGTAIVLAFIGFISFILFFVVRMSTDYRANHDLVTEDYYRAELGYQQELDDQNNTSRNNVELTIAQTVDGILVSFPSHLNPTEISGTISLYRPSNKKLDATLEISLSDNEMLIPKNLLMEGRWDIKVAWDYQGESYLTKEKLVY